MASPLHPNSFAVRQEVLFRRKDDGTWLEGTIQGVAVDDRTDRTHSNGHAEYCDEFVYIITDHRRDAMGTSDRPKPIAECQCDVYIADADSTGRWHEQQLLGPEELALMLVDTIRRGKRVLTELVVSEDDPETVPDRVWALEVPGYHRLAWAHADDLMAWTSGIPAAEWEVPSE